MTMISGETPEQPKQPDALAINLKNAQQVQHELRNVRAQLYSLHMQEIALVNESQAYGKIAADYQAQAEELKKDE